MMLGQRSMVEERERERERERIITTSHNEALTFILLLFTQTYVGED